MTAIEKLNEFVAAYNRTELYPTVKDVAKGLDLSVSRVKSKASEVRAMNRRGVEGVAAIVWRSGPDPLAGSAVAIEAIDEELEPITDIIARACAHNERYEASAEAKDCVEVRIEESGWFGIAGPGDPHLNNPGTRLRRAFREAEIIRDTPGLYSIAIGDYLDNFIIGRLERARREDTVSHTQAWRIQSHYFEVIGGKILGGVFGNHDCVDEATEALTQRGWKSVDEILENDLVLGFDTETGAAVWQPIQAKIVKSGPAELNLMQGAAFDLACTDGHRVLHATRTHKDGEHSRKPWTFCEFKEMKNARTYLPVSASSSTQAEVSDADIVLAAWLLTDGHVDKKHNYLRVSQRESNAESVRKALRDAGMEWSECVRHRELAPICGKEIKTNEPSITFSVNASSSAEFVARAFPDLKSKLPDWVHSLSNQQFEVFMNALIDGDGTQPKHTSQSAVLHGVKPFLDAVQAACVAHGYSAHIVEYRAGSFRLNVCKREAVEFDFNKEGRVEKLPYSGRVWCLTVPLSNFMIRRGGKAHFTGNCWIENLSGLNVLKMELKALGISGAFSSAEQRIRIITQDREFVHLIRHNFPGHSKYHPTHGILAWALERWQGEHAYWGGHIHCSGHMLLQRDWMGESRAVNLVQLHSYKKIDGYAKEGGFRENQVLETPILLVNASTGEQFLVPEFERGVMLLKTLRAAG